MYWQCLDGLGTWLQTLILNVRGSNPDVGSIYSINRVIPGLGFLQKTQWPWPLAFHCTISSDHWMVIEKNFHMLCVIDHKIDITALLLLLHGIWIVYSMWDRHWKEFHVYVFNDVLKKRKFILCSLKISNSFFKICST